MIHHDHDDTQRASAGNQQALTELIRTYQSAVFNVTYRMLGERRDAEDAAQETFIRALRALHNLDSSRPAGPWLRRIAVNVCLNRLDKKESLLLDEDHPSLSTSPSGEHTSLEVQVMDQERNAQIRQAMLTLPPRFRAVIEMRHFQELSYAEMARTLGLPLSDVKSDLFRARRLLAKQLKELMR